MYLAWRTKLSSYVEKKKNVKMHVTNAKSMEKIRYM